ncbi:MAG: GNAT family N-acetyltransferase [Bacteroidales bacterium]|nr:GNAT family N-acetyltransferase [Bacteroidales bacterium]
MRNNQGYTIHRMSDKEIVSSFDCGDDDLNEFIIKESPLYKKAMLAVTYVLATEGDPNNVCAFCSLANDRVSIGDFESKTEFNRFRRKNDFPQSKRMRSYPAVKICRLAVDLQMKGRNAGTFLLDFIKAYFASNNKTGCRFVTVDAYINAIPFYKKNGFDFLNADDEHSEHTRLMYFDLNAVV